MAQKSYLFHAFCDIEGVDPETLEREPDGTEVMPEKQPALRRINALMAYLQKGCLQLTGPASHSAETAMAKTQLALSKFDVFGVEVWGEVVAAGKGLERVVADVRGRMN